MVPFILNTQNRQIYRNRGRLVVVRGQESGSNGSYYSKGERWPGVI